MATARQTTSSEGGGSGTTKGAASGSGAGKGTTRKLTAARVASRAAEQLRDLAGRDVESVTGLERTDDGWTVQVEVVESRRIPDSADILALYKVRVDSGGELTDFRRLQRYGRGQTRSE